jgi:hypothetical protein
MDPADTIDTKDGQLGLSMRVEGHRGQAADAGSTTRADSHTERLQGSVPKAGSAGAGGDDPVKACKVEEIKKGGKDSRDEDIERIFCRRDEYAIYLASGNITVQFANCPIKASEQIKAIAELLPLRNKLQYLGRGFASKMVSGSKGPETTRCYYGQIADAFRLGLEGQVPMGRNVLQDAINDLQALVERDGRACYLRAGMTTVSYFLVAAIVGACGAAWFQSDLFTKLFVAIGSGALGAMLSIAMGIRNRTVAIDGYAPVNTMEAAVRILIGVISGVVLYLILSSGVVVGMDSMLAAQESAGGATLQPTDIAAWKLTILVGFLGGFVERLVPDLLDNTGSRLTAAATSSSQK